MWKRLQFPDWFQHILTEDLVTGFCDDHDRKFKWGWFYTNTQILRCLNPWTFTPTYRKTAVIVTRPRHEHASRHVQEQPHLQVVCVLIQLSKGGKLPRPADSEQSCDAHKALPHVSWGPEVWANVQNSSLQRRYVHCMTSKQEPPCS